MFCPLGSGPICSCNQSTSGNVNISCTMIYADHPFAGYSIDAVMNCTANGQVYNAITPTRTLLPSNTTQYVFSSTSYIVVNNIGPAIYDCLVKFSAPPYPPTGYLVNNVPDFNVTRSGRCIPYKHSSGRVRQMEISITFIIRR